MLVYDSFVDECECCGKLTVCHYVEINYTEYVLCDCCVDDFGHHAENDISDEQAMEV